MSKVVPSVLPANRSLDRHRRAASTWLLFPAAAMLLGGFSRPEPSSTVVVVHNYPRPEPNRPQAGG